MKNIKNIVYSVIGKSYARECHNRDIIFAKDYESVLSEFKVLTDSYDSEKSAESPIFIFSAGWRSGSTLLQRLISSDDQTLIWGEPYDRMTIVQSLSRTFLPISNTWPPYDYFGKLDSIQSLSKSWIANLYPRPLELLEANRGYMDILFARPAKSKGAKRWGIKEVRYGLKEALYLKLLYPNCKLILIKRNLFDTYSSYKKFAPSMDWYSEWPKHRAFTPFSFARHRRRLINEFDSIERLTDCYALDYEELLNNETTVKRLSEYCEVKIDSNVLEARIGSGKERKSNERNEITAFERMLLRAGDQF